MSCNNSKPCGCKDQALNTPPPCNTSGPCAGETCSELFCAECIVQCQPDISVTGENLNVVIPQGMRLDEIIQTLLVNMVAPECVGVSAVGLKLTSKSSTTITIRWVAIAGVNYTVTWQEGINVTTAVVHDVTSYTLTNLIPDTEYTVKLVTEAGPCESVTMTIKTNATS
jgi:Fibronectin type III domain